MFLLKRVNIPAHEIEVQQQKQLYITSLRVGRGRWTDNEKKHIFVDHGKINSPEYILIGENRLKCEEN